MQWKGPGQEYSETERLVTVTSPRHQIAGLTKGEEYTVGIAASERRRIAVQPPRRLR